MCTANWLEAQRKRGREGSLQVPSLHFNQYVHTLCAGLSSLELLRAFPGSRVTALDLSPHFVAVGKYEQQQREVRRWRIRSKVGQGESRSTPSHLAAYQH